MPPPPCLGNYLIEFDWIRGCGWCEYMSECRESPLDDSSRSPKSLELKDIEIQLPFSFEEELLLFLRSGG